MVTATGGVGITSTILVPHDSHSVSEVREAVARDLATRGCAPALAEDVVLVLSEIVSNALKHARPLPSGKVRVRWTVRSDGVDVDVTDGGGGTRPRITTPSMSATGGRGLGIVNDLSQEWGVVEDGAESRVWARLDAAAATRRPDLRGLSDT